MSPINLQKAGSFNMWRHIVNFWSMVMFAAIIYDFFTSNYLSHEEILLAIAAIYCATLAVYSAEKEFRRWHDMHSSMHPGEMYFLIWTALIILVIVGSIVYNPAYHIPAEVSASYIAEITILAITRESKNYYKRKRNRK